MSIEKVKQYFEGFGLLQQIKEFDEPSETVEQAAKAVGCDYKMIAKTMSFLLNDGAILIVTAGDAKVENRKFKDIFAQKAKMIPFEDVEKYTGHEPGGVCPFANPEDIKVYLDVSLKRFDKVYPAAGNGKSAIELTIPELEKYSSFCGWIDVCKDWI